MRTLVCAAVLATLAGCAAAPAGHVPADGRWLHAEGRLNAAPGAFPTDRPLRVAVFGDVQGNRDAVRAVMASIRRQNPDLVLFLGDACTDLPTGHLPDWGVAAWAIPFWPQSARGQTGFGLLSLVPFPALLHAGPLRLAAPPHDPEGFNLFLEETWELRSAGVPMVFVPGNHDLYHRSQREELASLLAAPSPAALWSAVDAGPCRFIALDGGSDLWGDADPLREGGEQETWLVGQLKDAAAKNLMPIVCLHYPPYSSAEFEPPMPEATRLAERVLSKHGVRLVLSGHAHMYERIVTRLRDADLTFVVTGGAGGPFTRVDPKRRDPGQKAAIEGLHHWVLLEIDAGGVRGRTVVLEPGSAESRPMWHEERDRFEIERSPR